MPTDDTPSPSPPTPDGVPIQETLAGEPLPFGQMPTLAQRPGEQPTLPAPRGVPSPSVRVPGYEILRELGRGGMGVVYLARQEGLDRAVALKMILHGRHAGADELGRFRAEAQAIARLKHPNIVQVYAIGTHDDLPYFAMEYCGGDSLARTFAERRLSPREAADLTARLARAVGAAHASGIVHRDLKPGNVLLAADGTPKLTDFGLAKLVDAEAEHTRTGAVIGTVSYMAPEQAEGRVREVGPLSDVYALGVILYECLTGRPPFRGSTATATLAQVRGQEPVPPRRLQGKCPRDLETVCLKCLQKEPRQRYPSAEALADDLHRFLEGRPVLVRPVSSVARALKWVRRHPTAAALSPLTAASALGVLLFCLSTARLTAERTKLHALLDRSNQELSLARAEIERLRGGPSTGDHASPAARIQQLRGWLAGGAGAPAGVARLLQEPTLRPDLKRLTTLLERLAGPETPTAADRASALGCLHDLRQNFRHLLTTEQARADWSLREEVEVEGLFGLVEAEVRRL